MKKILTIMIGYCCLMLPLNGYAELTDENPVSAKLIADVGDMKPGEDFRLGVHFVIKPGWHIYWRNPGESGKPTTVNFEIPDDFIKYPIRYPAPITFTQPGGVKGIGYEDQVIVSTILHPAKDLKLGRRLEFNAEVEWLACGQDLCVPGKERLTTHLQLGPMAHPKNSDLFDQFELQIPVNVNAQESPALASIKGKLVTMGGDGIYTIYLSWGEPPGDVEWLAAPNPSLNIHPIAVETKGTRTRIKFRASVLPGVFLNNKVMDTIVIYKLNDDSRRSLYIPVKFK